MKAKPGPELDRFRFIHSVIFLIKNTIIGHACSYDIINIIKIIEAIERPKEIHQFKLCIHLVVSDSLPDDIIPNSVSAVTFFMSSKRKTNQTQPLLRWARSAHRT